MIDTKENTFKNIEKISEMSLTGTNNTLTKAAKDIKKK